MLAYDCKQCGRIVVGGYVNEYDEHFCGKNCYKIYCGIHGYEVHLEKLNEIKLP